MPTIQSGLKQNTKNYNNFSYFLQGVDVTQQNLASFDPYLRGRSRIFMHTPPGFMCATGSEFNTMINNFKSYLETGYTQISGIQDISVDFTSFEGGFNGQKFENVSTAKDDTDTLTISLYEQSGSPVRECIETWVTAVRDPRSGIAHYHGAIDNGQCSYGEKFHTAEFIYYVLDPTGRQIEYACMFAHCFPRKVAKDHYNYEQGNMDNVLLDIEFSTTKYESIYINQIASWYNYIDRLNYSYLDFNPNRDSNGANDPDTARNKVNMNYNLNLDAASIAISTADHPGNTSLNIIKETGQVEKWNDTNSTNRGTIKDSLYKAK